MRRLTSWALPDIPTIGESIPGFEASGWCGVVAPRNPPIEIIDKLNREINARLASEGGHRDQRAVRTGYQSKWDVCE
jgi:tripartite-type tricarboxylate transporter receptor subunit TctC